MPTNPTTNNHEDEDDIVAERHLYRDYPLTRDMLEDAIEDGTVRPIYTSNGARFFRVGEVDALVEAMNEEGADAPPRGRRNPRGRAEEADEPSDNEDGETD